MRVSTLLLFVVALLATPLSNPASAAEVSPFAVFGYLPNYRYNAPGGYNYSAAFQMGLTHLIFYGGVHPSKSYTPYGLETLPSKEQIALAREAANNVGDSSSKGKLMLCVGGSGLNGGFAGTAGTDATREKFLTELNEVLVEYGLDGIDYRWEFPLTPEEWTDFRDLIAQSKEMLLDGDAIVTFTIGFSRQHMKEVKVNDIMTYADYVHFTAYDQRDRHSTVSFVEQVIKMVTVKGDLGPNTNNAVGKKFSLGLPFFGRKRNGAEARAYNEIVPVIEKVITKQEQTKQKNSKEKAGSAKGKGAGDALSNAVLAEVSKMDEYQKMYWNSKETIKQKVTLAKEAGLGGVMIWELGQDVQPCDSPKSLMWGIKEALEGSSTKSP